MGTNNFHYRNTSNCYMLDAEDDYDCRDIVDNVRETFSQKFKENYRDRSGYDWHELRSFPSVIIGQVFEYKQYGDVSVGVIVTIVIRSGYYEGACFDWLLEFDTGGSECIQDDMPTKEDIITDFEYHSNNNLGWCSLMSSMVLAWMEKTTERLTRDIEKVMREICDHELEYLGSTSNGEAFYREKNVQS